MKKILLSTMLTGVAVGVLAQGQINLGNYDNPYLLQRDGINPSPTNTIYGLFWLDLDGSGPIAPALINTDFNVSFYGAADANNLVLLKTFVDSGGGALPFDGFGPGTFLDLSYQPVSIPGALTDAFFRIEAWIGGPTLQSATYSATSPVFENFIGNPYGLPPSVPTTFFHMPAMVLTPVPEPSTFALGSLGAVMLLIFSHRK